MWKRENPHGATLTEHTTRFELIDTTLAEHTTRFDGLDRTVGQILEIVQGRADD